jgi:hypothetical protein
MINYKFSHLIKGLSLFVKIKPEFIGNQGQTWFPVPHASKKFLIINALECQTELLIRKVIFDRHYLKCDKIFKLITIPE